MRLPNLTTILAGAALLAAATTPMETKADLTTVANSDLGNYGISQTSEGYTGESDFGTVSHSNDDIDNSIAYASFLNQSLTIKPTTGFVADNVVVDGSGYLDLANQVAALNPRMSTQDVLNNMSFGLYGSGVNDNSKWDSTSSMDPTTLDLTFNEPGGLGVDKLDAGSSLNYGLSLSTDALDSDGDGVKDIFVELADGNYSFMADEAVMASDFYKGLVANSMALVNENGSTFDAGDGLNEYLTNDLGYVAFKGIPEPATLTLIGLAGLIGLATRKRS